MPISRVSEHLSVLLAHGLILAIADFPPDARSWLERGLEVSSALLARIWSADTDQYQEGPGLSGSLQHTADGNTAGSGVSLLVKGYPLR